MTLTAEVPTLWDEDEPRVRRTDPVESHQAADRSQKTLPLVQARVLDLLRIHGTATGSVLNEQYCLLHGTGLRARGYDTPRKRTSNLLAANLIEVAGTIDGERSFRLTDKGRKAVQA